MPVIKPALHHVTFKTSRLDEMMAWYGTVLGGTINFKDDSNGFAFLSVPGLEDDPDKVKHNAMHHSAFEYESGIRDRSWTRELQPSKSAFGTKRTSQSRSAMSAFGVKRT
jgi:catechol 2,3-dioxygenase-like lactoylglutathione lyase family enzyme